MCCCMHFLEWYGVKSFNWNLNENQRNIGPYVAAQTLDPHNDAIKASELWQKWQNGTRGESGIWIGQGPMQNYNGVESCLRSYSTRQGIVGKLAGVIYRIVETFNNIMFGSCDWTEARNTIARFLLAERQLANGSHIMMAADPTQHLLQGLRPQAPEAIPADLEAQAEALLKGMLLQYNNLLRA